MLDSTDPDQVRRFERRIDPARTLFIVSSKSGTTLEPNVLMDYFFAKARGRRRRGEAARHFVAITDPGSRLQKIAEAKGFRRVFFGIPSIGGRYSVLSHFGLVPLAAIGHDVRAFLETGARHGAFLRARRAAGGKSRRRARPRHRRSRRCTAATS